MKANGFAVEPVADGLEAIEKARAFVAIDAVGAGAGETIYWCRGREASFLV